MSQKRKDVSIENFSLDEIDARVLGQMMAAQNVLFVLPSRKKMVSFLTELLSPIPGTKTCNVCLGYTREGSLDDKVCNACKDSTIKGEKDTISKEFSCELRSLANTFVIPLETMDYRFGFFAFLIDNQKTFELYQPFIYNLGNFVALMLENRLQKDDLRNARNTLEHRVEERTRELQLIHAQNLANQKLNEAVNAARLHLIQFSLTHSMDDLIEETLNETEKLTGSLIGFYHFVDDDQQSLTLQNWSSRTKAIFCTAKGKGLHYPISEAGVWTDCVQQRKVVIHNDYASLPHRKGMPEGHAEVIRELVVPVFRGKKISAILGVGNKLTDYTEKDVETVSLLADLAWEIAERKRAEEALYTSQQLFRSLVENLPDLIVRYGRDYKRTYVNPAFLRESKIPKQELLSTTPIQRSPLTKDGAVILQNLLQNALENGVAGSIDILWPKEDRSERWYNVFVIPEFNRKGKVVSAMTISRNITERKQIEQERLAQFKFFECIDQVNKAIQSTNNLEQMMSDVLDVVLTVLDCDRTFLLYPCDPEANAWTSPMERNKPEYPGVLKPNRKIPIDADMAKTFHILLKADGPVQFGPGTPNDLPKDISKQFSLKCFMAMALYPKVGSPWQFGIHQCSHARDWTKEEIRLFQEIGRRLEDSLTGLITYRNLVESEEALRTNEERFRMAQTISHVGNWEYDLRTTHFWGSDEAKRIYGFEPDQPNFTTDEVENCIPERERVHQALIDLIETNKEYNLEFEIRPINSSEPKIINSIAKIVHDEHGKPLKVVGVIQDITMRKRVEEEILKLNQELEQRVAMRTAQLEAANKELEAFAYSVSHDLRAPLRHINGFMRLFIEQNASILDQKSQSYIDSISDASKRMGTLIDDLLSFSRMGRLEMSTRQVNLQVIVQEIIQEMSPDYTGRTIHWQISELPEVIGDKSLLRVVLSNLIANAIKFTRPREQARIEIGYNTSETEIIIFVRDNGVGFDSDYIDKLFGVFKRLHRTEEFEGTGIGLANVRRIIERHGGKTWAEGSIDQGATFYFSLPLSN